MNFKDAKAVVTGAASGLGRATAARVIQAGGQVALLDLQDAAGQAVAVELGTQASFHRCDVTSEAEVDASMQAAAQRMEGIKPAGELRRCHRRRACAGQARADGRGFLCTGRAHQPARHLPVR